MRAAVIHELGATPVVEEHDEPVRGRGQALVESAAAGVNPVDLAIGAGVFYGGHPPLPFVAGREGAGRVIEGEGFAPGTLVATLKTASGSMAERFVADEAELWEIPSEADPVAATALGIAGLAGWLAVEERGRIQEGDRVLVLGATGTVGSVAVQAARLLGASRVVAAGRDAERLERALRLGADATAVLEGDLVEVFRAVFPDGGPDLVIDPLWGPPALAAIAIAPVGMRFVNLGQSAGASVELTSAAVRGRLLEIIGHTVFEAAHADLARGHRAMLAHVAAGELEVDVETFPLDRAPEAWEAQKAGPAHKLVVTVR
ncbi:MAG TPA: zinc-binding alcohol dehydrogenase family protein [Gaiellales bacterium]|jgi:NADPH:quinone reductase|nr:zinc-binding alcohol dehydrogenase family protein [Gaiellales bacterium]